MPAAQKRLRLFDLQRQTLNGCTCRRAAAGGSSFCRADSPLDDAAVNALGRHVAGHVKEPDALPLVEEVPQVFRREDQLLSTPGGISGIGGQEATDAARKQYRGNQTQNDLTHRVALLRDARGLSIVPAPPAHYWRAVKVYRLSGVQPINRT